MARIACHTIRFMIFTATLSIHISWVIHCGLHSYIIHPYLVAHSLRSSQLHYPSISRGSFTTVFTATLSIHISWLIHCCLHSYIIHPYLVGHSLRSPQLHYPSISRGSFTAVFTQLRGNRVFSCESIAPCGGALWSRMLRVVRCSLSQYISSRGLPPLRKAHTSR